MIFEKIYEEVAKEHGVSVEEVKKEIEEAMKGSNVNINNIDEFIIFITSKFILDEKTVTI